jgi:hypothetical protein
MVVDLPRRWRWVMGAGCALVAVIALLFVVFSRPGEPAVVAVTAGAAPVFELPLVDAPPQSTAAPSAVESAEGHGPDEVQLCGGAWVRMDPDGTMNDADFERAAHDPKARERILSSMRASGSEFTRASALVLEMLGGDEAHRAAFLYDGITCKVAACGATEEALADIARQRDALARLAVGSNDAKVYALAIRVCGDRHANDGACQLLSAEQWARLDPDNAVPWSFMLARAAARGDRAAQDNALFRMASARRNEIGFLAMPALILEATPDDDAGRFAAWMMTMEASNFEGFGALSDGQVSLSVCGAAALQDLNRAQICSGVAELLAERSDTFLARGIGIGIGKRVGWAADRLDRMRGEYTAYLVEQMKREELKRERINAFGCSVVEQDLAMLRRQVLRGEVGALREWIANSGKRPEDFVVEERLRQQQLAREAERAASASAEARPRPRAAASAASN